MPFLSCSSRKEPFFPSPLATSESRHIHLVTPLLCPMLSAEWTGSLFKQGLRIKWIFVQPKPGGALSSHDPNRKSPYCVSHIYLASLEFFKKEKHKVPVQRLQLM